MDGCRLLFGKKMKASDKERDGRNMGGGGKGRCRVVKPADYLSRLTWRDCLAFPRLGDVLPAN